MENQNKVVVVASDFIQKQRIAALLNPSNYSVSFVSSVSEIHTAKGAIVVCHKASGDTPKLKALACYGHRRIIVLSDCQIEKRIVATLEQGAHHYFNTGESDRLLEARLRAVLRQYHLKISEYSPYRFHFTGHQVEVSGQKIFLNQREFDCAHYLFSNKDRVVKTEELMVSVWALPPYLDSCRINTAICRLRKKLELDGQKHGWFLHRIRGVGFKLTNETSAVTD